METKTPREIALSHPEEETRSMVLPEGKYCQDCIGFLQCHAFSAIEPLSEVCQWYPNRFKEFNYNTKLINPLEQI